MNPDLTPVIELERLLEVHKDHKSLVWELQWISDNPEWSEGPWHRLAIARNIVTRYYNNRLVKQDVIYKPRPEKRYKFLGISHGAGWCQGERKPVYWDPESGQLFHREPDDYKERMANAPTR